MSKTIDSNEFNKPNPKALYDLFSGIRNIAPDLKTLHIDNVNPGTIVNYPDESKEILEIIIKHHTPGDVAAFGVESVDPEVIKQNNLKVNRDQLFEAISMFNEYGGKQCANGMPELLPGLNFVFGLKGETKKTFDLNFLFLKEIIKNNLLVRRINLRQVIPLPGTPMFDFGTVMIRKHRKYFQSFKFKVKNEIEKPLLEKCIPKGTVLTDVINEIWKGNTSFGRQMGSYPILVGFPGQFPLEQNFNIKILDHGFRSVTGVPIPLNINNCPKQTLEYLPGIGKKRSKRIIQNRPYRNAKELVAVLDDPSITNNIISLLTFE